MQRVATPIVECIDASCYRGCTPFKGLDVGWLQPPLRNTVVFSALVLVQGHRGSPDRQTTENRFFTFRVLRVVNSYAMIQPD